MMVVVVVVVMVVVVVAGAGDRWQVTSTSSYTSCHATTHHVKPC